MSTGKCTMPSWVDSIDSLRIPNRAYNALKRAGLTRISQIESLEDDELLCVRNLGKASLRAIRSAVPRLDGPTVEEAPFPMTPHIPKQASTTRTNERTQP